ncbi:MAG: hypothetical protein RLY24_1212 [Actinomycetota bacterium]
MMNDPLLPPPAPAGRPATTQKTRRPGVANSAKILATGLATTATLGLTAGYALASKTQNQEAPEQSNLQTSPTITTPNVPTTAPAPNTRDTSAPEVTSPPVVEIPVPSIAPAQPGNNWGNSGNNQPSSGSN